MTGRFDQFESEGFGTCDRLRPTAFVSKYIKNTIKRGERRRDQSEHY